MKRVVYHITEKPDGSWQGKIPRATRASTVGETKATVVKATREIAHNQPLAQMVIHKSHAHDSVIQTEHTYGADPRKYKG
ncbi:MAG: DUF2188 domain-containing protein [Opitutus sp.]